MAKVKPRNKLRFAWWGAEEAGLVGSTAYVTGLSQAERDKITLYLNFDMVGSPNHVFFIYDGDDSDATGAPAGPGRARRRSRRRSSGTSTASASRSRAPTSTVGPTTARSSRSASRRAACSPAPRASRPPQEAAIWGGTAGQQYDPCYHLACDTFANNNDHALDVNSDAVAYATLQYAMNTSDVNGVRGKGNFKLPPFLPEQ